MPSRSDAELQDVLKWLSTYSPAQPKLVQVDAATLLDTLLAQQVAPLLTPYYSLSSPLSSPLSSFGVNELVPPQDVIDAYPALLVLFLSSLLPLCFYLLDISHYITIVYTSQYRKAFYCCLLSSTFVCCLVFLLLSLFIFEKMRYNELVSHVRSQLTLDMDSGWSWPIPEFIPTTRMSSLFRSSLLPSSLLLSSSSALLFLPFFSSLLFPFCFACFNIFFFL